MTDNDNNWLCMTSLLPQAFWHLQSVHLHLSARFPGRHSQPVNIHNQRTILNTTKTRNWSPNIKKKLQSPIEKYGVTSLAYRQQSRGHAVQSAMKMVLKSISKPYFQTKLEDVTTRSTHERFCTGGSLRRGAISSVWTFTFTFIPETANLHQGSRPHKILTTAWV